MDLKILYEDNQVVVVFKPRGILSQSDGTRSPDILSMVKNYIKVKYNKPNEAYIGLVHRLDRNTSGVMVFARTSKAASRLSDNIKNHEGFDKEYLCVVEGALNGDKMLKDMMYFDETKKISIIKNTPSSKEAILTYHSMAVRDNLSLIRVELKTGRHHQIRCQMANISHPIYGDIKYGSKNKCGDYYALTAYRLSFIHPTLKEKMTFTYIDYDDIFNKFSDVIKKEKH